MPSPERALRLSVPGILRAEFPGDEDVDDLPLAVGERSGVEAAPDMLRGLEQLGQADVSGERPATTPLVASALSQARPCSSSMSARSMKAMRLMVPSGLSAHGTIPRDREIRGGETDGGWGGAPFTSRRELDLSPQQLSRAPSCD